jgi:hypothetical protein
VFPFSFLILPRFLDSSCQSKHKDTYILLLQAKKAFILTHRLFFVLLLLPKMASFHFSNDVPQSVLDNLQRLAQFSVGQVASYTDMMLEFLASGNANGLIESLKNFSSEHSVGIAVLKNLAQAYLVLLKSYISFVVSSFSRCLSE